MRAGLPFVVQSRCTTEITALEFGVTKGRDSIVFIVPGFPGDELETDCVPDVQNFVRVFARLHPELSVHVIAFQYPFKKRTYTWNGVNVHALAGGNRRFPLRLRAWLDAALQLRRIVHAEHVVALHSMWLAECSYVASWFSRWSGVKHIATICGQDALRANPYLK